MFTATLKDSSPVKGSRANSCTCREKAWCANGNAVILCCANACEVVPNRVAQQEVSTHKQRTSSEDSIATKTTSATAATMNGRRATPVE